MSVPKVWMVRSDGGNLYDFFKDNSVVGIGWELLAEKAIMGANREELLEYYNQIEPNTKTKKKVSDVSQVFRFVNDIQIGTWVVTYSPVNRTYLLGKVNGSTKYTEEWKEDNLSISKQVIWQEKEIFRDSLTQATRNSLGSILTVFELPENASEELIRVLHQEPSKKVPHQDDTEQIFEENIFKDLELKAFEKIKDLINQLDWKEMQELVAGVLRAMGYKTQISLSGSDRGRDIVASPDGFGFEHPRIIVEVKHRVSTMGSQEIRSFLGGRHSGDSGLYVSTGGFTREARYEADRAKIPLALWSLDELAKALIQNYDQVDYTIKQLVPLKMTYFPI
ncbi:restriction endonuclease [Spirabiliibacterium falconis]|uniref:restriction endonuclease n=1 Tax=Spirabiliibacterium falconis TaxID=572023 RepID=UPI001AACDC6A|nr:restriction endonuclease [Spirabiliibacterium falconis]MBE2894858.1 restriction endonuclease [Spirabiliibacterium falconis]